MSNAERELLISIGVALRSLITDYVSINGDPSGRLAAGIGEVARATNAVRSEKRP